MLAHGVTEARIAIEKKKASSSESSRRQSSQAFITPYRAGCFAIKAPGRSFNWRLSRVRGRLKIRRESVRSSARKLGSAFPKARANAVRRNAQSHACSSSPHPVRVSARVPRNAITATSFRSHGVWLLLHRRRRVSPPGGPRAIRARVAARGSYRSRSLARAYIYSPEAG